MTIFSDTPISPYWSALIIFHIFLCSESPGFEATATSQRSEKIQPSLDGIIMGYQTAFYEKKELFTIYCYIIIWCYITYYLEDWKNNLEILKWISYEFWIITDQKWHKKGLFLPEMTSPWVSEPTEIDPPNVARTVKIPQATPCWQGNQPTDWNFPFPIIHLSASWIT